MPIRPIIKLELIECHTFEGRFFNSYYVENFNHSTKFTDSAFHNVKSL